MAVWSDFASWSRLAGFCSLWLSTVVPVVPRKHRDEKQYDAKSAVGSSIRRHQARRAPMLIAHANQPRHVDGGKVAGCVESGVCTGCGMFAVPHNIENQRGEHGESESLRD